MILSSKTIATLKLLIDLGERHASDTFISLVDIAKRKDLSKKFLEQIVPALKKEGMIIGNRGNQGGYKLAKGPKEFTLKEILEITEYDLFGKMGTSSQAIDEVLSGMDGALTQYLANVTLQDLIDKEVASYSNTYFI